MNDSNVPTQERDQSQVGTEEKVADATGATMSCALINDFGDQDLEQTLSWSDTWERPTRTPNKKLLLLRVLACSSAAGDAHMISGRVSFVLPVKTFPFIPCMAVCGVVEEADRDSKFKEGDIVVATNGAQPQGGMAQYAVVREKYAAKKPDGVDVLSAAACPDSAVTALLATRKAEIKAGTRVLVLGASGGVGSAAVQLARHAGAAHVAATSSQVDIMRSLGVDRPINYREENWWEIAQYTDDPFDVIIDCAGGNDHFAKSPAVLKKRGRFVAVVGDEPHVVVKSAGQLLKFVCTSLWRPIWTTFSFSSPNYFMFVSGSSSELVSSVLGMMAEGKLRILLEPSSPYPFTLEGVRSALQLQLSGHAHGKVVVRVSEEK